MVLEALYVVSTATTKISILLFYRRLAAGSVSNGFIYSVYAAIAFVVAYFIVFIVNLFIGCRPIYAFWMQVDPYWNAENDRKYKCFNEANNIIAAAVVSVIQDFIACGMPMVLFWKLRIPKRQKIALGAIFGVGFFLCICGILRVVSTVRVYFDTYDMTWESNEAWIWFAIEAHVAVICASAPALKIFFKHAVGGGSSWSSYIRRSSFRRSKSYKTGSGATGSSTNRTVGEGGDKTCTTMASSEKLRRNSLDSVEGKGESGLRVTHDDIALDDIDVESNYHNERHNY